MGRDAFSDGPIVRRLYVGYVAPWQDFVKLGGLWAGQWQYGFAGRAGHHGGLGFVGVAMAECAARGDGAFVF